MRDNVKLENFKNIHVPLITLSNGDHIPVIGFGTFGSDSVQPETVKKAIYSGCRQLRWVVFYSS
jgi:diketogulonate reductase-like aldo/keto reductase